MNIEFEIHITTSDLSEEEVRSFKVFCKSINAKPILIELSKGKQHRQPMISKVVKCNTKSELEKELNWLKNQFEMNDYTITRTKIEIPPWQRANAENYYVGQTEKYYEWHCKVDVDDEELVNNICSIYNGRLSKNRLKNEENRKFITMRESDNETLIGTRIKNLKENLKQNGITIYKEELEYCIYDSNKSLDNGWID